MDKEQFRQITEETYNFLNNKGVNFICYIWSRDGEFGGGCQSLEADMGDALVAIERITKRFNIDIEALGPALIKSRQEMEEG